MSIAAGRIKSSLVEQDTGKVATALKSEDIGSAPTSFFNHNFNQISVYPRQNPLLQTKLKINTPGDRYEQEADAVSEKIMQSSQTGTIQRMTSPPVILRKCSKCEEEEEQSKVLHRKESNSNSVQASHAVTQTLESAGAPLNTRDRTFMEKRFGFDFSKIRVHNDGLAHQSANDIHALAYTHQHHIVFGAGRYQPNTDEGKRLLAHELTHTIQQRPGDRVARQEDKDEDEKEKQEEPVKADKGGDSVEVNPEAKTTDEPSTSTTDAAAPTTPQLGHAAAPAGVASCPDAPAKKTPNISCDTSSTTLPPKEKAVLPAPPSGPFGGSAERAKFAKELAQCRAEREVKAEIEKRYKKDVAAAKKETIAENKEELKQAREAMKGLDRKDKEAIREAKEEIKSLKKSGAQRLKDVPSQVTKQDVTEVTDELALKYQQYYEKDYADTIDKAFLRFGDDWMKTMQRRLEAARKKITKAKNAKPKRVRKGETPPPSKTPEEIEAEIVSEMNEKRCEQQRWVAEKIEVINFAWGVGRREQVDFLTLRQKVARLKDFKPSYQVPESDRVDLPEKVQPKEKARKGVAPELADFMTALADDPNTPKFTASNRAGHGGGDWKGKGFSADIYISAPLDARGFWEHSVAVKFLLALDEKAKKFGARWRVLYDDLKVAKEVNSITGSQNVIFQGVSSGDRLNWHGPAGLILHFHLDLEIPKKSAPSVTP